MKKSMKNFRSSAFFKVNKEDISISYSRMELNGTMWRYEVIVKDWPCPVAIAYVQFYGTQNHKIRADLLYMIVFKKELRRQGIGTFMHKKIEEHCDIINTCSTSKESLPFMKKRGYKYIEPIDEYVLNKKH